MTIPTTQYSRGFKSPLNSWVFEEDTLFGQLALFGGGLLSFLIGYVVFGFIIALVLLTIILSVGGVAIFVKQHKGLHSKKSPKGIYIFLSFSALLIENSFDSK